ncbi:MFS transporter [Haloplanus pelagicus]|jgi:MFS family permease|uniref:MFS transporter n=1 Tax=Haloplanus pelagicus TaxID=2949995 RepID=UPI002041435C|nr:MFS transporter [Haloplanus sp. HW8-1]
MADQHETVFTGYTGRMSLILSFGWLVALLGRGVLSPLLPEIIDSLAISSFQAGLVLSVMMALHSLIQYPAGAFSDHLSRTTVLSVSLGVLTLGFGLFALSNTYWTFFLGGAFVGLGTGLYYTPQRSMLSDLFVERRGRAFGVNFAAGAFGSALSAGLAVVVLGTWAWQRSFLPLVVLSFVVLLLLHTVSRESYVLGWVKPDVGGTAGRILRSREIRGLILAYALFSFTWQGVVGFLPTYLQATKSLSPTVASAGFALLFVVAMVVMPVAGNLSDSFPRPTVAIVALGCAVLGLAALLAVSAVPLVLVTIVVFSVGVRAYPPVMQAHLMDLVPDENTGGDFGAIKTVYTLIGSVGPLYVGYVSDVASYTIAFAGLGVSLLASIVISAWLTR